MNRLLVIFLLVACSGISNLLAAPNPVLITGKRKTATLKLRSDSPTSESQTQIVFAPTPDSSDSAVQPIIVASKPSEPALTPAKAETLNTDNGNNKESAKNPDLEIPVVPEPTIIIKPVESNNKINETGEEIESSASNNAPEAGSDPHEDILEDDAPTAEEDDAVTVENAGTGNKTSTVENTNTKVPSNSTETGVVPLPKPSSFLNRMKNVFKRFFAFIGLNRLFHQRTERKLKGDFSMEDALGMRFSKKSRYVQDVRAAVGALLGKRDCFKRACCAAGTYFQEIQGKELLFVLMEKFIPDILRESLDHIRESAMYRDSCDYDCVLE